MVAAVAELLGTVGRSFLFFGEVMSYILRGKIRWVDVFRQIYEQGVQTLLIVMMTSFASGAVLAMQSQVVLERFSAKEFIAQLVALSLVRELSPVFTALVFSGKAGAGMAAELGTMSVNNQIQATRTLGVDPIEFLIVPRVLACMIVLPILGVLSEILGIVGGYVIATTQAGIPGVYYYHQTVNAIGYVDFFCGFVKVCCFAVMIGWISCYQGFYTSGGSLGVGRFTTKAVAFCYISVLVSNAFLTRLVLTIWGS
ncbi:MAG: ABC transporter permease [Candidatus Omnitrophica bacterium]|nr:ABC transporter permease [Candidatus Omnitrophota bacterium]